MLAELSGFIVYFIDDEDSPAVNIGPHIGVNVHVVGAGGPANVPISGTHRGFPRLSGLLINALAHATGFGLNRKIKTIPLCVSEFPVIGLALGWRVLGVSLIAHKLKVVSGLNRNRRGACARALACELAIELGLLHHIEVGPALFAYFFDTIRKRLIVGQAILVFRKFLRNVLEGRHP